MYLCIISGGQENMFLIGRNLFTIVSKRLSCVRAKTDISSRIRNVFFPQHIAYI